jgi:ABC-type sugar transport system ATPase subunit
MAQIVLEGVSKCFPDGALAVKDVNFDIADGEFVILVGPSGCGKSTTLNMIAELEELAADSGLRDTGAESAQQVVARLNAATHAREGEPVELVVDLAKAHVFDPATGVNLTHPQSIDRSPS